MPILPTKNYPEVELNTIFFGFKNIVSIEKHKKLEKRLAIWVYLLENSLLR